MSVKPRKIENVLRKVDKLISKFPFPSEFDKDIANAYWMNVLLRTPTLTRVTPPINAIFLNDVI